MPADAPAPADRRNGPCFYCEEPCNNLAGNPGLWPLILPLDPTRPGYCLPVHTQCVLLRLRLMPKSDLLTKPETWLRSKDFTIQDLTKIPGTLKSSASVASGAGPTSHTDAEGRSDSAPADAERLAASNDHWSVTVSRHGEEIVTMETNCLSGREISPDDERTIRTAAEMLLAFIGDASPEGLRTLLDEREAEVARLREQGESAMKTADWVISRAVDFDNDDEEYCSIHLPFLKQQIAIALDHAAQSAREAALDEMRTLREFGEFLAYCEAGEIPTRTRKGGAASDTDTYEMAHASVWMLDRLQRAIRALITKGGAE